MHLGYRKFVGIHDFRVSEKMKGPLSDSLESEYLGVESEEDPLVIEAHPPPHDPRFRVEAWGGEG